MSDPLKVEIALPEPDAIRARIDQVDEEARLLRRLLRLVLRLKTSGMKRSADRKASKP